jgi:RNA polymerase sigma-70 factor (ECF subfamily)
MSGVPLAHVLPATLADSAGDRLAVLFDTHYDRLYRLARRLAASADAAGDLVQDTFLRAARSPRSIPHGQAAEEAWLVRVLVNLQRDEWRRASVRAKHATTLRPSAGVPRDADESFVAHATVWHALDTLTPRRRAVLVLHEIDGLSVPDIAAMLGIARVTVRWHLSRGRVELARTLGADTGGRP